MLTGRYTTEEIARGEYHVLTVEAETHIQKTKFGKIEVLETQSYGRGLFLDGRIQHVQADEYVYSEGMVHPAMFFLKEKCETALCIGGGPGGICRELLKYPFIKKIYQVDIDADVIAVSRKYLQHISRGCWDNPRCELMIRDAYSFLEETPLRFDLIICDLSEPFSGSPAVKFFTEEGIRLIQKRLTPQGIYTAWAGPANPRSMDLTSRIVFTLAQVFPVHIPYFLYTQTFGTSWISVMGTSVSINPLSDSPEAIDRHLSKNAVEDLQYYDGSTHHNMFHLPKNVRTKLSEANRAITLADPCYISGAILE